MLVKLKRQRGKGKGTKPNTTEGEGSEAAIGFVDVVCARAAMVGEEGIGDEQWRSAMKIDGGACSGGGTSRHWLRPSLRSGLGFVGGEVGSGQPRD